MENYNRINVGVESTNGNSRLFLIVSIFKELIFDLNIIKYVKMFLKNK